ncbi:MAG: hypothetical protein UV52_C0047G0005 [Parcubacteria group bacterium GW2011_GWD1_42_9]|nr:MAG: hypothetical protein UV52_C0047G0005 [Parcubacteria group bacterium GW2011_GWD1_42_9]KKT27644.1 MAG: hypothetical protein UW12_C0018G0011 [Parcubacteria group bacterium GW2011_GWF1_43_9]
MQTTSPKVVFNNFDDGTFIAFLKKHLSRRTKVGKVEILNGYTDNVVVVFYAILPRRKNFLNYDTGRTACIIVTKDGYHYELSGTFDSFWPITIPKSLFQTNQLKKYLMEISHFLSYGNIITPSLHEKMANLGPDQRWHRVVRANAKCKDLESIFGVKTGGASEG